MNRLLPVLGLLLAWASLPAAASAAASVGSADAVQSSQPGSTVRRFSGGASAQFTVSVRIIRASGAAFVGEGLGPPAPLMSPRRTTVTATDGTPVPALVYDFE